MNNKNYFYITLMISVIVQIFSGILEFSALFVKVPSEHILIRQLLVLELFVQFIEAMFYAWVVYNFNNITNITPKRYIDWTVTTPIMLITLVFYLIFLENREKDTNKQLKIFDLLLENSTNITYILILNWFMLLFGYMGEMKIIPTLTGVGLGFVPFLIYYFIIYINYAVLSKTGLVLFWYFFIFWSLYGVVAVFPYYIKNSLYNILDLFSKNFFGLFLSYKILTNSY